MQHFHFWRRCWLGSFLLVVSGLSSLFAHNPETSYCRLSIVPNRLMVRFTFDITTLVLIVPNLDADGDRRLTEEELQTAVPAIVSFLQKSIPVEIDGQATDWGAIQPVPWPAKPGETLAEKDFHAPTSLVSFHFVKPLEKPPADVWLRFEFFEKVGLTHTVLGVIEHDGKDHEVLFDVSEPDYLFETNDMPPMTATATPAENSNAPHTTPQRRSSNETIWSRLALFFRFGVEHIFLGYDHILFLLSLIIVSRFGELVKIVTSFTVAHSITLALATLRWVEIPSNLVETAIAATIIYTAIENFWIRDTSGRWKLTFVFGLIHGFGFAGVLRELALPTEGFVRSLLAFNLGVEVGQLLIVAILAVPAALVARWSYGKIAQNIVSAAIALCGVGWLLDRGLGFEIMWF